MSEHGKRFDDTFIGKLIRLWPLISAFILLLFTAVMMYAKVNAHDDILKVNVQKFSQNDRDHKEFDERLTRLETIPDDLEEIKDLIRSRR